MTSVNDFLMENVDSQIETKEIKFKGFKSPFVIKSITADEQSALMKGATRKTKDRQTRQITSQVDQDKYVDDLIVAAVQEPDLNNEQLQKSWGCLADPSRLIKKMLLAGQYTDLASEIQELSGFDAEDINELVDDVKK